MATRSYTSRSEFEQYRFSAVVTIAVPFVLILLQAALPKVFPRLLILDLPLIAVIFFAVARRNPILGALTGAAIGLVEDALTGLPIGINGIAKTVIGYAASSIGLQVDVENITTRILMNFGFSIIQSGLLFLIQRYLLGIAGYRIAWLHELYRALFNTLVAIPVFLLLDRWKLRD
jgi:rod shape-determining protein MreD